MNQVLQPYGQINTATTLPLLRKVAENMWGGSPKVKVLDESSEHLSFDATQCKYAEFYHELGLTDVGLPND